MLGLNAAAWNTPGGIYDRFAGLMGVLAQAPNERRKIELAQQNHQDEMQLKRDELAAHQLYYGILSKNADNKATNGVKLPPFNPYKKEMVDTGQKSPLDGTTPIMAATYVRKSPKEIDLEMATRNYIARANGSTDDLEGPHSLPNTETGDATPPPPPSTGMNQSNPYESAITGGQGMSSAGGGLQVSPQMLAQTPANAQPQQMTPATQSGASPYAAAMGQPMAPNTKLEQFKQLMKTQGVESDPAPEFVPDLLGPDDSRRAAVLNGMAPGERIAAATALKQMGYR